MKLAQITFELKRIRVVETGVWCDGCALPSAVRVEALLIGPLMSAYVTRVLCTECGESKADR
ncbi:MULTISPECIES: hypothetical protein [unclassified Egicoccus]|uniref:hypothetical protein n=1 Tax=unclassified Egicoccus TaxID=2635606 RepID=UPI00359E087E